MIPASFSEVALRRWPEVAAVLPRVVTGKASQEESFRVLGLDLSLRRSGLCVIYPTNDQMTVRTWSVGAELERGASLRQQIERLGGIAAEAANAVVFHRVTHAVIEGSAYMKYGAHGLGELSGVVKYVLTAFSQVAIEVVPPMTARKALLGRATHGKVPVRQYAKERWGLDLPPDEADAFAVANWGWTKLAGWGFGPTQIELDGIARALKAEKKGKARR